jgi:tryptophan 2,3-dioxygenase
MCLEAVKKNGKELFYVKEQSPEICLEAVRHDGHLFIVKEQTPEICLEAMRRNGIALDCVKKQTPEICAASLAQYGEAMYLVKVSLEMSLKSFLILLSQ